VKRCWTGELSGRQRWRLLLIELRFLSGGFVMDEKRVYVSLGSIDWRKKGMESLYSGIIDKINIPTYDQALMDGI
jgi:hypothetical protein